MALLFMDGFDHYTSYLYLSGKWFSASTGGNSSQIQTTARTGPRSAATYYAGVADDLRTPPLPVSGNGFVVGMAVNPTIAATGPNEFIRIREGVSIQHMSCVFTTGNVLQVKTGATVLATGVVPLPVNAWSYVEFKGVIDSVNGSYEVRVDGLTVPLLTNAGPVATRNGGTGQWDRVGVLSVVEQWNGYFDDVYVCDHSGAAPKNTFLGPVKIETIYPQTDAIGGVGANVGLSPSTGTDRGALVDETPANTTDYNSGATVGLKDTYNFPTPTISGTILGIQMNLYVAKSDAAARQVCPVVRVDGADVDGANVAPTTTFMIYPQLWPQKPGGTPTEWTLADLTAIQAGMKVTA
jgi:hypothetical protein